MKRIPLSIVLGALLLAPDAEAQQSRNPIEIKEWEVPYGADTRPRDPFAFEGRVWFVGQAGNYVAYLDPASGEFKRYEIEEGTHPHNLIVDERGVWYAGNRNARIGLLNPETGSIRTFPMPDPAARDPHTLVFADNGTLWFTAQQGGFIGHLVPNSGDVHLVKTAERARPYGINLDPQGRPWVNLFGTNLIATVDAATMELKTYAIPREAARTRRIEVTSDGIVWAVDYAQGFLIRFDPATGQFKEWPMPGGSESRPYAMEVDDMDRLWFVESGIQPNTFVGFDPKTESFFSITPIPSGGGTVRHMYFEPTKREIWFGTDVGTIGKAVLPK
ncbi:MAG: virginiamycin B lyase family protein [Longimicrobiales bacterium]